MLMLLSGSQMVNERSCNCPHLVRPLGFVEILVYFDVLLSAPEAV